MTVNESDFDMGSRIDKSFFKRQLRSACEEGILLFAKYGILALLIYGALIFGSDIVAGSSNGTQSIIYLNELQKKGYLPRVVNGQIPDKPTSENNDVKKNP